MGTENRVVKARGRDVEPGWRWAKVGKMGNICNSIDNKNNSKNFLKRIEMSGLTNFWRLTLSETISDFRIFSSLFSFQLTLGISPSSVQSSQQFTLHCSHSLLRKVTYFSSFIDQLLGDRHQLTLLAGCTFKCAFFPKRLRRKSV